MWWSRSGVASSVPSGEVGGQSPSTPTGAPSPASGDAINDLCVGKEENESLGEDGEGDDGADKPKSRAADLEGTLGDDDPDSKGAGNVY